MLYLHKSRKGKLFLFLFRIYIMIFFKGEVNQKMIFKTHFWFSKYFNVNIGIYRSEI